MDSAARYEILDNMASGDFATVLRARDRELGREVAIKQIHAQFLADPQRLARYWQEAQLLASLQHANVLTIYDIVRPRGWLVLELMQGSLKQVATGEPLDLDLLRSALIDSLHALDFLHRNGVIHGDVKPSNLLIDAHRRVKLGDFGLARRASSDEGSLLKGTTKYMAPELVSDQFGPVGPASDLYSLGFAAYELMCGAQFESLFPGLSAFGRDRQIAWMMWHAAADRRLPEIIKVLQGVPGDLALAIQRMVEKPQSHRYQSAAEVLAYLQPAGGGVYQPPVQEDKNAQALDATEAKRKRLVRIGAIVAFAFSLLLSALMLFDGAPRPKPAGPPQPVQGVIAQVYPDEYRVAVQSGEGGQVEEVSFDRYARFFLNDQVVVLRDLKPGDKVLVKTVREQGKRYPVAEVYASRPKTNSGTVESVQADEGQLTMLLDGSSGQVDSLALAVPAETPIIVNGQTHLDDRTLGLADLLPDDRVTVEHYATDTGQRAALKITALRVVREEGLLRDIDVKGKTLTLAVGNPEKPKLVKLPLGDPCEVTLNDRRVIDERVVKPADLKPGDKVTVDHDTHVVRVSAYRVLGDAGVIRRVQYAANTLDVVLDKGRRAVAYLVGPKTEITLSGEPVTLEELRDGDRVDIRHDSPGVKSPEALSVSATRPADAKRWALLIGVQQYDDRTMARLEHPVADAEFLRETLVKRYKVPANQVLLLTDPSQVRLEQTVASWLEKISPDASVLLYYAGHAFADDKGSVYLAPRNFHRDRAASSGVALQWLVDTFEACRAKQKLLLLDTCQPGLAGQAIDQPSTAEMIRALKTPPGRAPLRTITAIASCSPSQRGTVLAATKRSAMADCLAKAYGGEADKNRDVSLEPTELFEFLKPCLAKTTQDAQTPVLFLPDDRPPRLSEDAKRAIRRLAAFVGQDHIDTQTAAAQYAEAAKLAGSELEPALLYGLVLMKSKQRDESLKHLEELHVEHPDMVLPQMGLAWVRFDKRAYPAAVNDLRNLLTSIPPLAAPDKYYPESIQRAFYLAGQLREYAGSALPENWRPPTESLAALDQLAADRGPDATRFYQLGRKRTQDVLADFDNRIATSTAEADLARLKVERRRLVHYVSFPYDYFTRQILDGLDR